MKKLLINVLVISLMSSCSAPIFTAESPDTRNSWFSQMWQAARDKASGFATGVRESAVSAQQKVSSYLPDVKSWSWAKVIAVSTAIATTFGVIIKIYNNNGDLVQTVGDISSSVKDTISDLSEIGPRGVLVEGIVAGVSIAAVIKDKFPTIGANVATVVASGAMQLCNDLMRTSSNPKECLDILNSKGDELGQKRFLSDLSKPIRIMIVAAASTYFLDLINTQKHQLLNYIEKVSLRDKLLGDFEKQIKLLSDPLTFTELNVKQKDYSEGIKQAKESIEKEFEIAKGNLDVLLKSLFTWLNDEYGEDINEKIKALRKIEGPASSYVNFPEKILALNKNWNNNARNYLIKRAIEKLNEFTKTLEEQRGVDDEIKRQKDRYLDYFRKEAPGDVEKQIELLSSQPSRLEQEKDYEAIRLAKESLEAEKSAVSSADTGQDDDARAEQLRRWVEEQSMIFKQHLRLAEQIKLLKDILAHRSFLPAHLPIDIDTKEGRNIVEKVIDEKELQ